MFGQGACIRGARSGHLFDLVVHTESSLFYVHFMISIGAEMCWRRRRMWNGTAAPQQSRLFSLFFLSHAWIVHFIVLLFLRGQTKILYWLENVGWSPFYVCVCVNLFIVS